MTEQRILMIQEVYDHIGWVIEFTFLSLIVLFFVFFIGVLLGYLFEAFKRRVRWKDWREAKIFIFEDICLFSFVLVCNLASDGFYSFLHDLELVDNPKPYHFGIEQSLVFVFFAALLARKIKQFRYFR